MSCKDKKRNFSNIMLFDNGTLLNCDVNLKSLGIKTDQHLKASVFQPDFKNISCLSTYRFENGKSQKICLSGPEKLKYYVFTTFD